MKQEIDEYIKGITQIANHDRIKKELEPNLMWHEEIQPHQTLRILYALSLFNQECKRKPKT